MKKNRICIRIFKILCILAIIGFSAMFANLLKNGAFCSYSPAKYGSHETPPIIAGSDAAENRRESLVEVNIGSAMAKALSFNTPELGDGIRSAQRGSVIIDVRHVLSSERKEEAISISHLRWGNIVAISIFLAICHMWPIWVGWFITTLVRTIKRSPQHSDEAGRRFAAQHI